MGQVIYFLSLNLTRIAELRKENLVKHMRKRTIQTGKLFFSSSLIFFFLVKSLQNSNTDKNICVIL